MKRVLALLVCFALLASLSGCITETGVRTYKGIYVKTENGQHVLIHSTNDGDEYFLLHETEDCRIMDKLKTGSKIKIKVAFLAYDDEEFSERRVISWSKSLFGHTDVSQETLDHIENLLTEYENP